jgi:hypothetical protein
MAWGNSTWPCFPIHEDAYRYLMASDLSWRTVDIVQAHTLRWLVEVFVQDWEAHEG